MKKKILALLKYFYYYFFKSLPILLRAVKEKDFSSKTQDLPFILQNFLL